MKEKITWAAFAVVTTVALVIAFRAAAANDARRAAMPAITVSGDFGSVTIVGDDAEAFLDEVFPQREVQFEDTTAENTTFDFVNGA